MAIGAMMTSAEHIHVIHVWHGTHESQQADPWVCINAGRLAETDKNITDNVLICVISHTPQCGGFYWGETYCLCFESQLLESGCVLN